MIIFTRYQQRLFIGNILALFILPACTILKNVPEGKPVIVSYKILNKNSKGNFKKNTIAKSLYDQNDLFINKKKKFGFTIIKNPPLFDSVKMLITLQNMQNTLANSGYFNNEISYRTKTKIKKTKKDGKQYRVSITFTIELHEPYYINDIVYVMKDTLLQQLVNKQIENSNENLYDEIFTTDRINTQIDNIVTLAHNTGLINLNEKAFDFQLDTTHIIRKKRSFLDFFTYKKKGRYVNVHIYTTVNPQTDTTQTFKQYFLRNIYFLPNVQVSDTERNTQFENYRNIFIDSKNNFIRPLALDKLNTMTPNQIFSQNSYDFTLKKFLQTNIWSVVNFTPNYQKDTTIGGKVYGQLDLTATMFKSKRYNANAELGLSFNMTPRTVLFTLPNRTLATSAKASFSIKNLFKTALETQIIGRAGIESLLNLSPNFSILLSEYTIDILNNIPWLFPFDFYKKNKETLKQTYFNFSLGLTNRINFYNLRYGSFSYAWLLNNPKKSVDISIEPIQMSLTRLTKLPIFEEEEKINPGITNAFNQGFIGGIAFSISKGINYKKATNNSSVIKINIEESGGTWGFLVHQFDKTIFQYIRSQFTFIHYYKLYKSTIAYRFLLGAGFTLNKDLTLPFYKQFFAGGPSSMRSWPATRLGLGSSPLIRELQFKDRYGDIYLETNLEYRFNIVTLNPVVVGGAIFTDIGNVWNRKIIPNEFPESKFQLNRLYRDIGIGSGLGLRIGVSFLLLRFDVGLRIKDPIYPLHQQYLNPENLKLKNIQLQIGLGYPF